MPLGAAPFGAPFDATLAGRPVSVKSRGPRGELCLGDYRRQAAVAVDFVLVVGQVDAGRCVRIDAYAVDADAWRALFAYAGADAMYAELKRFPAAAATTRRGTSSGAATPARSPPSAPATRCAAGSP